MIQKITLQNIIYKIYKKITNLKKKLNSYHPSSNYNALYYFLGYLSTQLDEQKIMQ